MSRIITICCSRCGAVITGGHSIVKPSAGPLAKRYDAPIDLCVECAERFEDWMRAPRDNTEVSGKRVPRDNHAIDDALVFHTFGPD
jgi:hypothetical protein